MNELLKETCAQLKRERDESDAIIQRILDVLGDEASPTWWDIVNDCGRLLRIEQAVRRILAERDRLRMAIDTCLLLDIAEGIATDPAHDIRAHALRQHAKKLKAALNTEPPPK